MPATGELTLEQLANAAGTLMEPDTVFSHETAAHLIGLPVPDPWVPSDPIHVMRHTQKPRIRRSGISSHRGLEHREVIWRAGLPCVGPADTWADLVESVSLDDLVVVGDAVAHWKNGIPLDLLQLVIDDRVGCRGVGAMREVLPLIRTRGDSPMETRARLVFVRGGFARMGFPFRCRRWSRATASWGVTPRRAQHPGTPRPNGTKVETPLCPNPS